MSLCRFPDSAVIGQRKIDGPAGLNFNVNTLPVLWFLICFIREYVERGRWIALLD